MTPVLTTEALSKSYRKNPALIGLEIALARGTITGILGPDGAGKTTAMRLLTGLLRPGSGRVLLGEEDVTGSRASSGRIGYMPQRFSLYPDLNVDENLRFYANIFGVRGRERRERTEQLLRFARLTPFRKRRAAALSGGMKQKLALACTLIHTPEILLLDEPTTGVDPISRVELWEILLELKEEGTTILVSTPYMDEADRCDVVLILREGIILDRGSPAELRSRFPYEIIEVEAGPVGDATRILEGIDSVREVVPFGTRLHLTMAAGGEDREMLRKALVGNGVTVGAMQSASPSLEDVFVALAAGVDDA